MGGSHVVAECLSNASTGIKNLVSIAPNAAQMLKNEGILHILVCFLDGHHFVLPSSSASAASVACALAFLRVVDGSVNTFRRTTGATASTEVDGLQFPPLAAPYSQERHQSSTCQLDGPPQPVRRYRVRIQRGDDEVEEVDGEGEVGYQFRARN